MDHGDRSESVLEMTTKILQFAERTVDHVFEQNGGTVKGPRGDQRLGSAALAHFAAKKFGYPEALCQATVSAWLKDHPTLVSPRGPDGGMQYKEDYDAKRAASNAAKFTIDPVTGKKVRAKVEKPVIEIPGLGDDDE